MVLRGEARRISGAEVPTQWGPWRYEASTFELIHEASNYPIDLDTCTSSADVLDWILQISAKQWDDDPMKNHETVGSLVDAFRDLLDPQATLCSFGSEQGPITPRAIAARNGYTVPA